MAPDEQNGSGGAQATGTSRYREYEFTALQDLIILKTAGRTRLSGVTALLFAGVLSLVVGLLLAIRSDATAFAAFDLVGMLMVLLPFLALIAFGTTSLKVAKSLKLVATTEGSDIKHLMNAIISVGRAFMAQAVVIVVWVSLAFLWSLLSATGAISG
jgi:hypothetical protein